MDSRNPTVDIVQVESAHVQGLGDRTSEKVVPNELFYNDKGPLVERNEGVQAVESSGYPN